MSMGQIIVLILLAFFTPAGIVLTVLYFKYRHLLCFTWHGSWQGFGLRRIAYSSPVLFKIGIWRLEIKMINNEKGEGEWV